MIERKIQLNDTMSLTITEDAEQTLLEATAQAMLIQKIAKAVDGVFNNPITDEDNNELPKAEIVDEKSFIEEYENCKDKTAMANKYHISKNTLKGRYYYYQRKNKDNTKLDWSEFSKQYEECVTKDQRLKLGKKFGLNNISSIYNKVYDLKRRNKK